jgi:hypothetical protein
MVAVQNLEGEIIYSEIRSVWRDGLISATPPNGSLDLNETLHSCNTLPADVHEGIWLTITTAPNN